MDDVDSAENQALVDRLLAELQAASEDGLLELTSETFEDRIDREATMALLTLAIRHFAWSVREDPAALEADPNLVGRLEATAQAFEDSAALLAKVALMDAIRCVKALTDYRAKHGTAPGT